MLFLDVAFHQATLLSPPIPFSSPLSFSYPLSTHPYSFFFSPQPLSLTVIFLPSFFWPLALSIPGRTFILTLFIFISWLQKKKKTVGDLKISSLCVCVCGCRVCLLCAESGFRISNVINMCVCVCEHAHQKAVNYFLYSLLLCSGIIFSSIWLFISSFPLYPTTPLFDISFETLICTCRQQWENLTLFGQTFWNVMCLKQSLCF